MAYVLLKAGEDYGNFGYSHQEFMIDSSDDLANIPASKLAPGSLAHTAGAGEIYELDSNRIWTRFGVSAGEGTYDEEEEEGGEPSETKRVLRSDNGLFTVSLPEASEYSPAGWPIYAQQDGEIDDRIHLKLFNTENMSKATAGDAYSYLYGFDLHVDGINTIDYGYYLPGRPNGLELFGGSGNMLSFIFLQQFGGEDELSILVQDPDSGETIDSITLPFVFEYIDDNPNEFDSVWIEPVLPPQGLIDPQTGEEVIQLTVNGGINEGGDQGPNDPSVKRYTFSYTAPSNDTTDAYIGFKAMTSAGYALGFWCEANSDDVGWSLMYDGDSSSDARRLINIPETTGCLDTVYYALENVVQHYWLRVESYLANQTIAITLDNQIPGGQE